MPGSRRARFTALAIALGLLAAACGAGGGASKTPTAVTASTEALPPGVEAISVAVIVPDYTTLIGTGDVPRFTPDFYADRWRAEAAALDDAATAPRWSLRFQVIAWNPVAGPEPVCQAIRASPAALFASATRLSPGVHDCLDADGRIALTLTPGRGASSRSVLAPTRAIARAAARHGLEVGLVNPPVVIVVGDDPSGSDAAQALERTLAGAAVPATTVTVPTSQGVQAVRDAAPATIGAITAAAPATVLFAANTTTAAELGAELLTGRWRTLGIDIDGLTDHWASGRLPPEWVGASTLTTLVPTTVAETEFESACRDQFEAFAAGDSSRPPRADWPISIGRNAASTRGAIDGSPSPPPDIGYHECTLLGALGRGLAQIEPPATDAELLAAIDAAGPHLVARGRQGDFAERGLTHHTLAVELRPPDDVACAPAGQQCWTTPTSDRSGMVAFR